MTTKLQDLLVTNTAGTKTQSATNAEYINASSYGAAVANGAAANSVAINAAIVAAALTNGNGFVVVNPGVIYTEASLVIPDGVVVLIQTTNGVIIHLTKDQGTALPVTKGGVVFKSQNNTGVMVRALDYAVAAEPILQFLNFTTGANAAINPKFVEMLEITDPTAPSANNGRVYVRDNGAGKTQLVVRFPTGAIQVIATEP